ncbi:uncharacterized protein LOC117326237 [Pecten maximus]|uniref:uncharacterized protein LOC117326237 n=1 Tax=Pecten maximus TaxID=6579 RepID=UPI0014582F0D|nr:uncharacterized protein LOC117326237 [Pecten maximus]
MEDDDASKIRDKDVVDVTMSENISKPDTTRDGAGILNRRPTPRELSRLSLLVEATMVTMLFIELGLSFEDIESVRHDCYPLAHITYITKLFLRWTYAYPKQTFHHIERAMTCIGMNTDHILEVIETEEESVVEDIVPIEVLARPPSDDEVKEITNFIGNTFVNLFLEMGLSMTVIEHQMLFPSGFNLKMKALLHYWKETFKEKATIGRLLTAMKVVKMDWYSTATIWATCQEKDDTRRRRLIKDQQKFMAGIADNVETPCNITVTVVGHKGVGKTCFVRQIKQEYIPEGGPNSTDTADLYINHLAYNPDTGVRKELDENGEEETGRQRIKRIIDRYDKMEMTDKDPSESTPNIQDQDKTPPTIKETPTNEVASTSLPSSSYTTKEVQRQTKSQARPSRLNEEARSVALSSEQKKLIEEIMLTVSKEDDKQMKGFITICDFGGEKVFYNTHHCFMSSNMVFVLVFDVAMCLDPVRSKDGYERIETWLKSIATFAVDQAALGKGTPPVILVGSHLDVISSDKEKQEAAFATVLNKLYENPHLSEIMEKHVQGVYPIPYLNHSKKNQDIYDEVWRKIIEIAPLQSRWGKPVPAKWVALEYQLVKLKKEGGIILTYEELLEINRKSAVPLTEHEIPYFLRNLRYAGSFLCFNLQNNTAFIVLKPQWIIDAFKAIITDRKFTAGLSRQLKLRWRKYEKSGILTLDFIRQLWRTNEDEIFLNNINTLCSIMETLGLLANPLLDKSNDEVDYYIVPSMLQTADPEIIRPILDDTETVTTVTLCIKFDNPFIPQAVWDKVIAACIHRFQQLNERGYDGSTFIQRGFVCLSVDFLWNVIINCSENVMKITMFKKDTDKSVPAGAGVNLLSILDFHLKRILKLNHQSHLKYQFYLHNDYSFSADDKMVKVAKLERTPRLQCHSSNDSRFLEREDLRVWFKGADWKAKGTHLEHNKLANELPDRSLSFKEVGRVSKHIGKSFSVFFGELGCPVEDVDRMRSENHGLSFRSLYTEIFIHLLMNMTDLSFARVAVTMLGHGIDQGKLSTVVDENRQTIFDVVALPASCLQKCLAVNDAPNIAKHVDPKAYFNLFLELGFHPTQIKEFDVNFRHKDSLEKITAMLKQYIKETQPCPTVNTLLLAIQECDMDIDAVITSLNCTKDMPMDVP